MAFIAAPFIAPSRTDALPAAPTAPEIPSTIAPELSHDAQTLFGDQVQSYLGAVQARNDAITTASAAAVRSSVNEDRLNWVSFWIALLALIVVLATPAVYDAFETNQREPSTPHRNSIARRSVGLGFLLVVVGAVAYFTRGVWWP